MLQLRKQFLLIVVLCGAFLACLVQSPTNAASCLYSCGSTRLGLFSLKSVLDTACDTGCYCGSLCPTSPLCVSVCTIAAYNSSLALLPLQTIESITVPTGTYKLFNTLISAPNCSSELVVRRKFSGPGTVPSGSVVVGGRSCGAFNVTAAGPVGFPFRLSSGAIYYENSTNSALGILPSSCFPGNRETAFTIDPVQNGTQLYGAFVYTLFVSSSGTPGHCIYKKM
jgi:hypothetical protein